MMLAYLFAPTPIWLAVCILRRTMSKGYEKDCPIKPKKRNVLDTEYPECSGIIQRIKI
jgi:hypothetical protein